VSSWFNEYAVVWAPYGPGRAAFDNDGQPRVKEPEEVAATWDVSIRVSSASNTENQSKPSTVLTDTYVPVDSILWQGRLDDLPDKPTDLYKVVGVDKLNDVKGRLEIYNLTLARHSDSIPSA
jgi:hypothetical protein